MKRHVSGYERTLARHKTFGTPQVISSPRILRIFQITGLTKALAVRHSVTDAITACSHWRKTAESQAGGVHEWCRLHGLY